MKHVQESGKSIYFMIAILSLTILFLTSFWLSVRESLQTESITVMPIVPREGEPVLIIFKLNNPLPKALSVSYQFYANGELLTKGETTIPAAFSETHQYVYENPLQIGEQLNFVVRTQSKEGNREKILSLPSYPPQIWSSFVSFASFSNIVMSSMSSMTYYQMTFGSNVGFNVGILVAVVLIGLLIFLELTRPVLQGKSIAILGELRLGFSTVTWILFIIFIGMVYTKIVMIVAGF